MSEKPSLNFETAKFTYDELEAQLRDFQPDPGRYPHDVPSIISVEEGIRAGRMGHEDLPDYGDVARPKTPEEGVDTPV